MSFKSTVFSNPYLSLLQTAWKYAGKEKGRYLLIYGMFIISNSAHGLTPLLWGWFINQVQQNGTDVLQSAWIYVGSFMGLHFIDWAFHGRARVMERELSFNLSKNFLEELYHKVIHLPVKWHQDNHSGATINRVRKAYEALSEFFQNGFRYVNVLAKFFFSFGAMLYFSPLFGGLSIIFGVVIVWVIFKFDKPFVAALHESNERQHIVSSTLFDSLSNIITVITLRLEKRMEKGLLSRVMHIFPPFRKQVVINEWKWFTVDTLVVMIYFTIMLGYIHQNYVPGEVFLIGGLVALMQYVDRFVGVFHDIAWQYTQIVQQHTDVNAAQNILDAYDKHHLPEENNVVDKNWKAIGIKHLNFDHNIDGEGQKIVQGLLDVNINLERGKKIALIGESGSGKSTLLALLRGLYPPKPGLTVTVDHHSFDDLGVISNHVTLFPQEPEIFENTIEYNITLGLPFEEKELEEVAEVVHFAEVARQLPKGYQSNIQEKGVNLSGGQKQRLALARGVLAAKDSTIVLLDEPTSSVDPKTELEIYSQLFEAFKDKVVVSALHRLHLLTKFDYVYVMDKGKIIDEGTFNHLLQHSLPFQELWRHQEDAIHSDK